MVKGTSSRQVSDSSIIKRVLPPKQTKFCRYADEFQVERGLSITGMDPRTLVGDKSILEKEWDAVFTCPMPVTGTNKKVKAYHVRPEFAEKLVHRHWDVYQEGPFNHEVGLLFAKAFAVENCPAARTGPTKEIYTIAWAPFAEQAMKSSEERHNIENKRRRWEDQMSGKTRVSHLEEGSTRSTKTADAWAGLPSPQVKLFEDEEKQQIHSLKRFTQDRLQVARTAVEVARSRVDVAVRDLHRAEGAQQSSSIATMLQGEITSMQDQETRGRLLALMSQLQANPLNNIAQLEETVLEAKVSHLSLMYSLVCLP